MERFKAELMDTMIIKNHSATADLVAEGAVEPRCKAMQKPTYAKTTRASMTRQRLTTTREFKNQHFAMSTKLDGCVGTFAVQ